MEIIPAKERQRFVEKWIILESIGHDTEVIKGKIKDEIEVKYREQIEIEAQNLEVDFIDVVIDELLRTEMLIKKLK